MGDVAQASSPAGSPGVPPGVRAGSGTLPQLAAGTDCATRFMDSPLSRGAGIGTMNRGARPGSAGILAGGLQLGGRAGKDAGAPRFMGRAGVRGLSDCLDTSEFPFPCHSFVCLYADGRGMIGRGMRPRIHLAQAGVPKAIELNFCRRMLFLSRVPPKLENIFPVALARFPRGGRRIPPTRFRERG